MCSAATTLTTLLLLLAGRGTEPPLLLYEDDYLVPDLGVVGPDEPLDGVPARLVRARGYSVEVAAQARRLLAAVDAALGEVSADYVLVDGGLIGLCRGHEGGMVPWDDDMDILVMRRDFGKLLADTGTSDALRRRGVTITEVVAGAMYKVSYLMHLRTHARTHATPTSS
jgi:hypothetical protein